LGAACPVQVTCNVRTLGFGIVAATLAGGLSEPAVAPFDPWPVIVQYARTARAVRKRAATTASRSPDACSSQFRPITASPWGFMKVSPIQGAARPVRETGGAGKWQTFAWFGRPRQASSAPDPGRTRPAQLPL